MASCPTKNGSASKSIFNKLKKSMLKDLKSEASFNGMDVCAIIISPQKDLPDAWSSAPAKFYHMMIQFLSMTESELAMLEPSLKTSLDAVAVKLKVKFEKEKREKRAKQMELMFGSLNRITDLSSLSMEDATEMQPLIEEYQTGIMECMKNWAKDQVTPSAGGNVGVVEDQTKARDIDKINQAVAQMMQLDQKNHLSD